MNLDPNELTILTILDETPNNHLVTITELTKKTKIRAAQVSRILLKLEREDYIEKVTPLRYRKNIPFIAT